MPPNKEMKKRKQDDGKNPVYSKCLRVHLYMV